jgi:hypothetical protein
MGTLREEGAPAGNIFDRFHLGEFTKMLSQGPWNRKAAGTLLYCGHMTNFAKICDGPDEFFYDVMESLPGAGGWASRTRCQDVE